nr:ATP-binding protein [Limisalsivibrio acetivorans]
MHYDSVQTWYEELVNRKEVVEIIESSLNDSHRRSARIKLYRHLYEFYERISKRGIRQLHFHMPNGNSLLRFHKPEKFGDNLISARYSVYLANTQKRVIRGFEAGKVVSGFRTVYPLISEGKHLGSVELSVPFELIRQETANLLPEREFQFVINAGQLEARLFKEQKGLHEPWPVSSNYWLEDPDNTLPDSALPLAEGYKNLSVQLKNNSKIQELLSERQSGAVMVKSGSKSYIVTLTSVNDVEGKNAGYLVGYETSEILASMNQSYSVSLWVGIVSCVIASMLIFEYLRNREEKNRERKRIEDIYETMDDALYLMNKEGRIVYANKSMEQMLGFSKDELLGSSAHELFHVHTDGGGSVPLAECPIYKTIIDKNRYSGDEVFIKKNGERFIARVKSTPFIEKGRVSGSVATFSDMTEDIKLREELEEFNTRLSQKVEQEVAERMKLTEEHKLQKELLVQQSKMAAMGEMVGAITHQLKQPLNVLGLRVQLLEDEAEMDGIDMDEISSYTKETMETIEFMDSTMNDFRNFFKPDKAKVKFSIRDSVEDVVRLMQSTLDKYNINCGIDGDSSLKVCSLCNEFKQVILNLVTNAKDAAYEKNKRGRISIRIYKEGDGAVVQLRDDAGGIPSDLLPDKLFAPYITTKGDKGTGIGLYMSKTIIEENMGGSLSVHNDSDGAVFTIKLPLC